MENNDSFFDFLDGTVGPVMVRPGEDTRRRHLDAMQKEMVRLRRNRYRNIGLGVFGALLIVVLFLVQLWDSGEETTVEHLGVNSSEQLKQNAVTGVKGVRSATSITSVDNQMTGEESAVTSNENARTAEKSGIKTSASYPELVDGISSGKKVKQLKSSGIIIPDEQVREFEFLHTMQAKPCDHFELGSERGLWQSRPVPDVFIRRNDDTVSVGKTEGRKMKFWLPGFSLGLHYTPEYMFNTLDQTDRLVHNTGLEMAWNKGPFTIRTGISLSVATGVTELAYHYNENLGVMQKLDSVVFTFDSEGRKIVPSWFFSEQQVFDTAEDVSVSSIRKRYTYLQIPLILGYDFLEMERFSLGFRAGPVLQILTSTRQLDDEPDYRNNRIISINQLTPGRLTTHWQALFGLNVSVILSRRISLEAEPHVKYYFNSVYEKAATTGKPWSIEWRTAFIYKF